MREGTSTNLQKLALFILAILSFLRKQESMKTLDSRLHGNDKFGYANLYNYAIGTGEWEIKILGFYFLFLTSHFLVS